MDIINKGLQKYKVYNPHTQGQVFLCWGVAIMDVQWKCIYPLNFFISTPAGYRSDKTTLKGINQNWPRIGVLVLGRCNIGHIVKMHHNSLYVFSTLGNKLSENAFILRNRLYSWSHICQTNDFIIVLSGNARKGLPKL